MGTISEQLAGAAEARGAELATGQDVVALATDGDVATVTTADGRTVRRPPGARATPPLRCSADCSASRSAAVPGGRPGQGQHAAVPPAARCAIGTCVRSGRSPARSTSTRATRQLERGVPAGRRWCAARPAAVRDLLPLAQRPDDPRPEPARRRRPHPDPVRTAHAGPPVRRRSRRLAGPRRPAILRSLDSVLAEPIEDCLLDPTASR